MSQKDTNMEQKGVSKSRSKRKITRLSIKKSQIAPRSTISYSCKMCGQDFTKRKDLQLHIKEQNHLKQFSCHLCPKMFARSDHLKSHILRHTKPGKHLCDQCDQRFKRADHLNYHKVNEHGKTISLKDLRSYNKPSTPKSNTQSRTIQCEVCGKSFVDERSLKQHNRVHSSSARYQCEHCDKSFAQRSNLNIHTRSHTGAKPYKCEVCGEGFNTSCKLKSHTRKHTGELPFVCHFCGKCFGENHLLKMHIRIHEDLKAYKCSHCGKSFNHSSTLKSHIRTHTGAKPFKCDICEEGFAQISSLKYHRRSHTGEKPFVCEICGNKYTRRTTLNTHMTHHTGKKLHSCSLCDFTYNVTGQLKKHMLRVHSNTNMSPLTTSSVNTMPVKSEPPLTFDHLKMSKLLGARLDSVDQAKVKSYTTSSTSNNAGGLANNNFLSASFTSPAADLKKPSNQLCNTTLSSTNPSPTRKDIAPSSSHPHPIINHDNNSSILHRYDMGMDPSPSTSVFDRSPHFQSYPVNPSTSTHPAKYFGHSHIFDLNNTAILSSSFQHVSSQPNFAVNSLPQTYSQLVESSQNINIIHDLSSNTNVGSPVTSGLPPGKSTISNSSQLHSNFQPKSLHSNLSDPSREASTKNCTTEGSHQQYFYHDLPFSTSTSITVDSLNNQHQNDFVHHPQKNVKELGGTNLDIPSSSLFPTTSEAECFNNSLINQTPNSKQTLANLIRDGTDTNHNLSSLLPLSSSNLRKTMDKTCQHSDSALVSTHVLKTNNTSTAPQFMSSPSLSTSILQNNQSSISTVRQSISPDANCTEFLKNSSEFESCHATSLHLVPPSNHVCDVNAKDVINEKETDHSRPTENDVNDNVKDEFPISTQGQNNHRSVSPSLNSEMNMKVKEEIEEEGDVDDDLGTNDASNTDDCYNNQPIVKTTDIKKEVETEISTSFIEEEACRQLRTEKARPEKLRILKKKSKYKKVISSKLSNKDHSADHINNNDIKVEHDIEHGRKSGKKTFQEKIKDPIAKVKISARKRGRPRKIDCNENKKTSSIKRKSYPCQICGENFSYSSNLSVHKRLHTGQKPYKCKFCGKDFSRPHHLSDHLLIHARTTQLKCLHCLNRFEDLSTLEDHIVKSHSGHFPFRCNCNGCVFSCIELLQLKAHVLQAHDQSDCSCHVCNSTFKTPDAIREHMNSHPGEKAFTCQECHKVFLQHSSLKLHFKKKHSKEMLFACGICNEAYITAAELHRHQRVHTGERPFACEVCKKAFQDAKQLRLHQRIHTGERHYQCSYCGNSFTHRSTLYAHMRIHTGHKPFKCDACGESFTQRSSLAQHRQTHNRQIWYTCHICGKSYTRISTLNIHLMGHSGKSRFNCPQCSYKTNKTSAFRKHLEKCQGFITPLQLEEMSVRFLASQNLQNV